jgi:hypothetical protein
MVDISNNIDNMVDLTEEYNEEHFKDLEYEYPLEFILGIKDNYKEIHADLLKIPMTDKVYKPRIITKSALNQRVLDPEEELQAFEEKLKQLLNQLSPKNYNEIATTLTKLTYNKEKLKCLANIIINKSIYEPKYTDLYAELCSVIKTINIPDMSVPSGKLLLFNVLLQETKKTFETSIIIDPDEADKLQDFDIDEHDLVEIKNKKLGIVKFVAELYNKKILIAKIVKGCFETMFKVIEICNENKHDVARDFVMECLIEYIKVLLKSKNNISDDTIKECIIKSKKLGMAYKNNRLKLMMDLAIDNFV